MLVKCQGQMAPNDANRSRMFLLELAQRRLDALAKRALELGEHLNHDRCFGVAARSRVRAQGDLLLLGGRWALGGLHQLRVDLGPRRASFHESARGYELSVDQL